MAEINMQEESSTPLTPSSNRWKLYFKDDGLYILDDLAQEIGPMVPRDGWIPVYDTWTYASATTITVPSDATLKYKKGWGIRLKQGGSFKYFYIIGVASTTLTITGGSDYTLTNTTITDVAVCPMPYSALGFPGTFTYSPTAGASITVGNGTTAGRFAIFGARVVWDAGFTFGSTSSMGSGAATITNPVTLASHPVDLYTGNGLILDAGVTRYMCYVDINTTHASIYNLTVSSSQVIRSNFSPTAPIAWATGDKIFVKGEGVLA